MATATWIDSIGDWFNSSDWSTGFVPGPGDDAVIPSGEPRVTTSTTVGSLSLTTNSSHLSLQGGLLGGNTPVTLNVLGPAPSTLIGDIYIGIGVLQFGSVYITAIGAGAVLDLNGNASGNARVAVNGQEGNSALIHLASNAGAFHISIIDGIATDVDFSNTGFISIEQGVLALGGVLNNSATFNIGGGFATVSATSLTNTGTLTLATEAIPGSGNARLSISGNASNAGTLNIDGTRGPSGSTLSVGGVLSNSGTLTLGNSFSANDLVTTVSAAGFVNSGTTTMVNTFSDHPLTFTVNGSASNSGTLGIGPHAILSVSSANAFSQTAGNTTVNGGALSTGQVNIAGGSLVFETALTNTAQTGSIMLSGGSLVEFAAAADSAEQVGFSGSGTIQLNVGALFAGTIFHFTSSGEAVDIRDLSDTNNDAHTSFDIATNRLTVFGDNGSMTFQLDAENYSGVSWSAQQDAAGATLVTASSPPSPQYVFFAPGQPINVATTTDPNNPPPPVPGDFNLEVVVNATGTGSYATAPGYQGLAIRSTDGHTLTLLHGDYGVVDNGAGNLILLGDGSESVGGGIGDTIQGGSGPNQFLDGHLGHESIIGGTAGNETIWGAATDTVRGGSGGNETIAGVPGETIFGSSGANVFINATAGNQSVLGGSAGNDSIWTAAGDTIRGGSNNEIIGGVAGVMMIGGSGGGEFFDASQGHQSVLGGSGGNETIWGAATDSVRGGSGGDETIAGVPGETIFGSSGANVFINATAGNQSVLGGFAGNDSIWTAAGDTIHGGASNNETVGGVAGVTMIGGTSGNEFLDASQGHQSVVGGSAGNETIWGAGTDTITGSNGANVTIGGVSGETIFPGSGGNTFIDATGGNQSIVGGTGGNLVVWSGAGDTIRGGGGNETIGGVPNDTIIGGSGPNQFIDGSQGHQSILGGTGGNETIWGALTDTIIGGSSGAETIAAVAGETILGGAATTFIDATAGSESILAGTGSTLVDCGAHDTIQGASGGGTAAIAFFGGNDIFWDDGATIGRQDLINLFNQSAGDRISLNGTTDDPNTVVATATSDSNGNAVLHLHDGSSIMLLGITTAQLTNGFFTTH